MAGLNHFSHSHPLELINTPQTDPSPPITCTACELNIIPGRPFYACRSCVYSLHHLCSSLPHTIKHPSDPDHELSLLPKPTHAESPFECKACGKIGNGFSYRCGSCSTDHHVLCTMMPCTFKCASHAAHPLSLAFEAPYEQHAFVCDECGKPGWNQWLYRCVGCQFDLHLGCAAMNPSA
ncbi:hypothetical protein QJS04_geneDACA009829 [Acorus gramineus]|uniref:DC1 domain-containing protein n=1 Tax=Acorus gramineus TaxID=55184 RepID=A0AAV9BCL7_ACOGR|nr:hypothetical protein QJS04_geneDACA009829 [Acorus gramineus]